MPMKKVKTDFEITPCTKCGAKAVLVENDGWYRVKCSRCKAAMHMDVPSPHEAIANWNSTTELIKRNRKGAAK